MLLRKPRLAVCTVWLPAEPLWADRPGLTLCLISPRSWLWPKPVQVEANLDWKGRPAVSRSASSSRPPRLSTSSRYSLCRRGSATPWGETFKSCVWPGGEQNLYYLSLGNRPLLYQLITICERVSCLVIWWRKYFRSTLIDIFFLLFPHFYVFMYVGCTHVYMHIRPKLDVTNLPLFLLLHSIRQGLSGKPELA